MNEIKLFAVVVTTACALAALVMAWVRRRRNDRYGRSLRYELLGTASLGAILPVGVFLKGRVDLIPFLAILIGLYATGSWLLKRARTLEP